MPAPRYTVGPGRLILRDGLPAFYVERVQDEIDLGGPKPVPGILTPTEADQMAHMVAGLLTENARVACIASERPSLTGWAVEASEDENGPIAVDLIGAPGLDAHIMVRKELAPGTFGECMLTLLNMFKSILPNEMESARQHRRTITRPVRIPRKRTH